MSSSIRTSAHPLHHSLSFDDQDQYLAEMSDENLFYNEYIDEMPTPQKNQPAKGGTYPSSGEQGASPGTRPPTNGNRHHVSPYLQKLPHSNFLYVKPPPSSAASSARQRKHQRAGHSQQHHRPRRSASASRTRGELLDAAYQPTNLDHLDLSSFFSVSNQSFRRPTSAPTRTNSASRKKKHLKTSHPRSHTRSQGFLLTLYRNGDNEKCCYCKASSLNAILQYATEKLRLPSAARRLFDANGDEIYRQEDILPNQEYYVSSGENFKDPFKSIQIQSEYGLSSTWTMKGLQMDSSKPKSFTTKTVVSKRLDQQIKTNVNLTMTENGFGHDDAAYHMLIDSVMKDNFDKFLDDATKKLELTAHARKVFNYRGDEIKSLRTFLESDESNMPTAHHGLITGPLWISRGERFRPTGAYVFLQTRYEEFRMLLKKEKQEHREILAVIRRRKRQTMIGNDHEHESSNDDTTDDDDAKVEIRNKGLLSMAKQEMKQLKESKEQKMKEIRSFMELYKSKMEEIQDEKSNEEALGAKFATEHIKEIKFEDKIVGRHPLSLVVHENGTFRSSDPTISLNLRNLPSKHADQTPIEYLLDHLQTSVEMFSRQRPKRVFDLNGIELKLVGQLRSKQHLFISYGEDYRPAFEPCLAIQLHSVDVYDVNNQQSLVKTFRPDDEIIADNEKRSAKQIAAAWVPTETLPADVRAINYATDLNDDQKQAFDAKNIHDRLNPKALFLHKDKKLIYPELRVTQKLSFDSKSKNSGDKQPPKKIFSDLDLQTWCYNKNGCIYNKQFPSLALTAVPEQPVQLTWIPGKLEKKRKTETLDGYAVQLRPKQTTLPDDQIWIFTTDGYIVCKAFLNFALTSLATITPEDSEKIVAHGIRINEDDPSVFFLAICPQCLSKSPFVHRQRWGIRQESTFTIGDWKYSKVENPLWHRMALTWPVDGTGSMIADLQWPVEGSLIPGVPPIKSLKSSQTVPVFAPIRLQVLKNGERDISKAASVVGPDISNLILEPKSSTNIYRRLRLPEPEKEQRTDRQMKRTADARQREMKLFLENCTSLCNLPFAARRLFDVRGTELFDLTSIERDAHVYVTCGEQWIDPELTKAEQQRRLLLAYLSNDVRMIYFYCALRNPTEYTLSIGKGLCDNSPLILNRCSLNAKERDRVKQGESIEQVVEHEEPTEAPATELEPK